MAFRQCRFSCFFSCGIKLLQCHLHVQHHHKKNLSKQALLRHRLISIWLQIWTIYILQTAEAAFSEANSHRPTELCPCWCRSFDLQTDNMIQRCRSGFAIINQWDDHTDKFYENELLSSCLMFRLKGLNSLFALCNYISMHDSTTCLGICLSLCVAGKATQKEPFCFRKISAWPNLQWRSSHRLQLYFDPSQFYTANLAHYLGDFRHLLPHVSSASTFPPGVAWDLDGTGTIETREQTREADRRTPNRCQLLSRHKCALVIGNL